MRKNKNTIFIICFSFVIFGLFTNNVNAKNNKLLFDNGDEKVIYVDSQKSDEDILKEMEKIENDELLEQAQKTRTTPAYTVELEFYRNEFKSTGFRVAGNQPEKGVNFGSGGGAFGYIDGNNASVVSMSFGVSGYGISASVGVGNRAAAGVNGYKINAPANQFVKLYVNKTVKVITYKRYKVYKINGYKEAYGYTTSMPTSYSLSFDVR